MKHLDLINEFREELANISRQVEISTSLGHFDLNKICEDLFCGLFRELYGYENLRNLNEDDKLNFPGVDLADDDARIAIQITSTENITKVKDSITKFFKYDLDKKYDRLIIYIISRKQKSYSQTSIDKILEKNFCFDVTKDIHDYSDIATTAATASPRALKNAVKILHSYSRGCDLGLAEEDFDPPTEPQETLSINLIELYFPTTLYVADIIPEVFEGKGGSKSYNQRKKLRDYSERLGITLPSAYMVHAGSLITFYNLRDQNNPFSKIIDIESITPLIPSEFHSLDIDHENIFKALLRFVLQEKLYKSQKVMWKYSEKIFIFLPIRDKDNLRKEQWIGQKKSSRTVFERRFRKEDPTKVNFQKHFSFSTDFLLLDNHWYMSVTPDWFFSFGPKYNYSSFSDKLLKGLKAMEKNRSIFDQFRFLTSWLSDLDQEDLFSVEENKSPSITFGEVVSLQGASSLNESLWEHLKVENTDDYEPNIQRVFGSI